MLNDSQRSLLIREIYLSLPFTYKDTNILWQASFSPFISSSLPLFYLRESWICLLGITHWKFQNIQATFQVFAPAVSPFTSAASLHLALRPFPRCSVQQRIQHPKRIHAHADGCAKQFPSCFPDFVLGDGSDNKKWGQESLRLLCLSW